MRMLGGSKSADEKQQPAGASDADFPPEDDDIPL
jgi:hypothetical protein